MAKSILITGGSGFIGSNYLRYAAKDALVHISAPPHSELDILDEDTVRRFFDLVHPDVMINFAAFRNATLAERERGDVHGAVWSTNVKGVEGICRVCQEYKTFLIHISTDMVFSGMDSRKGPYPESAKPETVMNALSWYGWTKAEGECAVSKNEYAAIIRIGNVTQPVYDPTLDYVGKILYLFDRGELYPLFDDQYCTLTPIPVLCEVIAALAKKKRPGTYHVATRDLCTPFALGSYLVEKMQGRRSVKLTRSSITSYLERTPHRYPQYGGLLSLETQRLLGIAMPGWKEVVDASFPLFHQRIEDTARSRDGFS